MGMAVRAAVNVLVVLLKTGEDVYALYAALAIRSVGWCVVRERYFSGGKIALP